MERLASESVRQCPLLRPEVYCARSGLPEPAAFEPPTEQHDFTGGEMRFGFLAISVCCCVCVCVCVWNSDTAYDMLLTACALFVVMPLCARLTCPTSGIEV